MKNVNTDSHIKIFTKYFKINQFNCQSYHFITESLLLVFWPCIVGQGICV